MAEDTFTPYAIVQAYREGTNISDSNSIIKEAAKRYPSGSGIGDEADAWRHLVWTAEMTRKYGPKFAELVGKWHEIPMPFGFGGTAALTQTKEEKEMDLYNNAIGIDIGKKAKSLEEIKQMATDAIKRHDAYVLPKPVYGQY